MKCDKAQEFFSDYIESTLDRPMTVALESHLTGCESCRTDVASLRSMWTVLDQVPQVEPPADFVWQTTTRLQNEFLNRKEAEQARPLPWWKRLTPVQSFSYVGITALLAVGLFVPTFETPVGDGKVSAWGLLFNQQAAQPPQFTVQLGANGGATVTVRTTTELQKARVWMGYMSPVERQLKTTLHPVTMPQTLTANEVVPVQVQPGGAKAARIALMFGEQSEKRIEKTLLLPGAPVENVSVRQGDPYYALQQVAARTGQTMLADAGLPPVTVDFSTLTPEQALEQIRQQTNAKVAVQPNGVVTITK